MKYTLLNSTQIKEEIPQIFLNTLNEMKIKTQLIKMCETQQKQILEKFIAFSMLKESTQIAISTLRL